jgi:hypothetical protein
MDAARQIGEEAGRLAEGQREVESVTARKGD